VDLARFSIASPKNTDSAFQPSNHNADEVLGLSTFSLRRRNKPPQSDLPQKAHRGAGVFLYRENKSLTAVYRHCVEVAHDLGVRSKIALLNMAQAWMGSADQI